MAKSGISLVEHRANMNRAREILSEIEQMARQYGSVFRTNQPMYRKPASAVNKLHEMIGAMEDFEARVIANKQAGSNRAC